MQFREFDQFCDVAHIAGLDERTYYRWCAVSSAGRGAVAVRLPCQSRVLPYLTAPIVSPTHAPLRPLGRR